MKKLGIIAACVATIGTGCSTQMIKGVEKDIEANLTEVEQQYEQAKRPISLRRPAVEVKQGSWLPSARVKMADRTPGHVAGQRQITINRDFMRIQEVAERVTLLTGIPVTISPEAIAPLEEEREAEDLMFNSNNGVGLPPVPGVNTSAQFMNQDLQRLNNRIVSISYSGPLSGFLDVASSRFNVYWAWDGEGENQRIRIFRMDTKTFRISALPGNTRLTSSVTNNSNSGGGAGGSGTTSASSQQQTEVSFDGLSVWQGVGEAIESMLTRTGAVTVTPSTGTVTVTDTPHVLTKVEQFVRDQNSSLGKQVTVNVRVLSVDVSDTDQYGVNWDMVYNSLSGRFGVGFASNFAPATDATNLAMRVLSTAGSDGSKISQWRGSEAIISALSKQGRVSQLTSAAVTTLNNQPVPVQVGRQTAYLASSQTTISDGQSSTALTPGTVSTGFSMNLVPHIIDQEALLLQYAVDLSSLISLGTISSGDSTIQTPEIETRNFLQRVRINSGDTLVVTGFEQSNWDASTRGIGSARNTLLGGGVEGNKQRNVLVILIQPTIAEI